MFESVSKRYGARFVVRDVSLEVRAGERMVILGASGCGKSTLLRLLAGFVPPDSGSVFIDGELVSTKGRIVRQPEDRHIGMVFQDLALWPHLSVKGNLEFGLKAKRVPGAERDERVRESLCLVRMQEYIKSKPGELSGGQQQRIALARALILHPKILLMDEPLSSLDIELNRTLRKEIIRIQETLELTLLYVTHNLEEAFEMSTRMVALKNGGIEVAGSPLEVKAHFASILAPYDAAEPFSPVPVHDQSLPGEVHKPERKPAP
jgi:ABC-type Fe3+/spermidine/putrescine transport system ATPase subunit